MFAFADGLARRGHQVHFIHGPVETGGLTSIGELWHAFEPSVTHHFVASLDDPSLPEADVIFATAAPARLGLPIAMVQGFRMLPFALERQAFRSRNPKVCVARWLCEVGRDFGVPPEQLWHVPVGIDHQLFADRTPPERRRYDIAICHNSHPAKGWGTGWNAIAEARRQRPGLRIAVFSATPIDDLDLERRGVAVHTGLERHRLAEDVYNASRVFVQPSLHEGFGFTAIEAMACGAALVTTDNGGSRDYAIHGETALVVAPGDVQAMADALVTLTDDESQRRRLAIAGERHTLRFEWDTGIAALEGHLECYLADPDRFRAAPVDEAPVHRW